MEKRKFRGVWLSKPMTARLIREACRWTGRGLHGLISRHLLPLRLRRRRLHFKRRLWTFARCNGREVKLRGRPIWKERKRGVVPFGNARLSCELLRLRLSAS